MSLDGPLDEIAYQKKAREQRYPLFALGLAPNSNTWSPLRENSWTFPLNPNDWVEERFPSLFLLCSGKAFDSSRDTHIQFAGSTMGPISAKSASDAEDMYFNIYDILLRATGWKDWILVENRDWLRKLLDSGIFDQSKTEIVKNDPSHESDRAKESRVAARHNVIATLWKRSTSGEKKLLGSCVNLSLSGTQVLLDRAMDLKVGDVFELSVRPSKIAANDKLDIYVELKGKLVWYNPKTLRLGIQFVELNQNTKSKLQLLIEHFV